MTLTYLVTKEIQLELADNQGNVDHFQAFPGTMYIPSLGIQLALHQEGEDRIIEYNKFNEFADCSLRAELAAILKHAPKDSFREIDVNGADALSITRAYEDLGKNLKLNTGYLFNSPK
jgi:hypothetical protein